MGADAHASHGRDHLPAELSRASDQRLVEHVLAGSERAFEVLFDRHHRPLLAFCRRMLGSREEAEDAAQQTLLAAYRELMRAGQPRELRPWLYGIARHRCLTALRAARARSLQELPEQGADLLTSEVTAREDLRAILADVSQLPDDQRAALVLAGLGDISHAEVARILGCPPNKVKALVFQARSHLTAERAARETPCAEIQEQLRTLRRGALRRTVLRRHLHDCPGCRAYRETLRVQRRWVGLLLPAAPTLGVKRSVLSALCGWGGAGTGGATLTSGVLSGAGLAVTALVTVAIPFGAVPAAMTAWRDGREAASPAPAREPRLTAAPANATSPIGSVDRAARGRDPGGPSANARVRNATRLREGLLQAMAGTSDRRPAMPEQASARDEAVQPNSRDQPELAKPQNAAKRSEPPNADRRAGPETPAKPLGPPQPDGRVAPAKPRKANRRVAPAKPPQANSHVAPAKPPQASSHVAPAKPPQANSHVAPAKPPEANGHVTPDKANGQAQSGPDAARESVPPPSPSTKPSPRRRRAGRVWERQPWRRRARARKPLSPDH